MGIWGSWLWRKNKRPPKKRVTGNYKRANTEPLRVSIRERGKRRSFEGGLPLSEPWSNAWHAAWSNWRCVCVFVCACVRVWCGNSRRGWWDDTPIKGTRDEALRLLLLLRSGRWRRLGGRGFRRGHLAPVSGDIVQPSWGLLQRSNLALRSLRQSKAKVSLKWHPGITTVLVGAEIIFCTFSPKGNLITCTFKLTLKS